MFMEAEKISLDLTNRILVFLNSSISLPGQEAVQLPVWLALALLISISILVLGTLRVSK